MRESWKSQRGSKLHFVGELARCLFLTISNCPQKNRLVSPQIEDRLQERFRKWEGAAPAYGEQRNHWNGPV